MIKLSVNVNKIAWLRNARNRTLPDLCSCTTDIIEAGAHGVTVHPRPDMRHIRPDDVMSISDLVTKHPNIEFNIEGNPSSTERRNGYPGFAYLIRRTRPDQCTLVPDNDEQLTSDHGWNLLESTTRQQVSDYISLFKSFGARVSLFMDPLADQIHAAAEVGADRIELYTGPWVDTVEAYGIDSSEANTELSKYQHAAELARSLGIGVNAGHDLNLHNVSRFCSIGNIDEVSIGHALIADALDLGLQATVKAYLATLPSNP